MLRKRRWPDRPTTEFTVSATRLMLPPFPPNYLATLLRQRTPNEKRGPLTDDKIPEGDDRWLPFKHISLEVLAQNASCCVNVCHMTLLIHERG